MLDRTLAFIKKFIPKSLFKALQPAYHFTLGYVSALWYGRPSEKMIVVGVTGTTGKTTVIYLLADILKAAGLKAGYISTAMFSDGEKEWLNDKKMTLPGRFFTQHLLGRMKKNGCSVAVVETTSQSVVQFRHRFINYDVLLFTGLYPEHVEAHGGFENYKKAKGELFSHLKNCRKKNINGKDIAKTIIVNADDKHAGYFLDFWADKKITFSTKGKNADMAGSNIKSGAGGISFLLNNMEVKMKVLGGFNAKNALAAGAVGKSLTVPLEKIKEGLEKITSIPGRLEKINSGKNFIIIVDYAYEPNAVAKLYETAKAIPHGKIIHVLGSAGGGRDKARQPKLGKLAGDNADYVIVTNEDPYDEDPMQIINEVFSGITPHPPTPSPGGRGWGEGVNIFRILDRREAIKKALTLAREKDIVLVTGKGSEQAICVANGKKIPWDDRKVIREVLREI